MSTRSIVRGAFAPLVTLALLVGCQTTPRTEEKKEKLEQNAPGALNHLKNEDPTLADRINSAYGYVVFPQVGKGGVIVGGAYGKGIVYEQGTQVGFADLTQASIGAQLGGQSFTEVILFENKEALDKFKNNQFAFAANASAVAIKSGAGAAAKYEDGVMVFTKPNGGLMFEASVGGQKFTYTAGQGTSQPATRPAT
jgi:lipid-binding SYLF domain-containing protein